MLYIYIDIFDWVGASSREPRIPYFGSGLRAARCMYSLYIEMCRCVCCPAFRRGICMGGKSPSGSCSHHLWYVVWVFRHAFLCLCVCFGLIYLLIAGFRKNPICKIQKSARCDWIYSNAGAARTLTPRRRPTSSPLVRPETLQPSLLLNTFLRICSPQKALAIHRTTLQHAGPFIGTWLPRRKRRADPKHKKTKKIIGIISDSAHKTDLLVVANRLGRKNQYG